MTKRITVILVCILMYSVNSQGFPPPPPPLPISAPISSALYENLSPGLQQDYHSVWCSSSTASHTYIAGPSSDNPNTSWAANQMFIVKYDNETMAPVDKVTFPINGYPYFVEEVSGDLYIGGVFAESGWNWQGFLWVLDSSTLSVKADYNFGSAYSVFDFTVDPDGNIYLIGTKWWNKEDVFIRKYDESMNPLSNELILSGSGNDCGWDVQYHTDGNIYIAGYTQNGLSSYPKNFPGDSYFVARCDDNLNPVAPVDFVYVGGSGNEFYNDFDIVINGNNLYLGAGTESTDMPGAINTLKGNADAFVAMIDISSSPLSVAKTLYLGGTGSEGMTGDVFAGNNQEGYLYYAGHTTSTDFEEVPVFAVQNENAGGTDIVIAKVNSDLSGAIATYIGGTGDDISYAFSADIDPNGDSYFFAAGFTDSSPFPDDPTGGLIKTVHQAAFLTRIDSLLNYLDAAKSILQELLETIQSLDPEVFKNEQKQETLVDKVNKVIDQVDQNDYTQALNKLMSNDLFGKTDGCSATGSPDANDSIQNCESQDLVYPLIIEAEKYLNKLLI